MSYVLNKINENIIEIIVIFSVQYSTVQYSIVQYSTV